MLYIAYGSNMNREQMKMRCPGARLLGRGLLTGYQLTFRGHDRNCHATIDKESNGRVPVLLWEITEEDERVLDRYEGFPTHSRKEHVLVDHARKQLLGMTYVINGQSEGRPAPAYFRCILRAYADAGMGDGPLRAALYRAEKNAKA